MGFACVSVNLCVKTAKRKGDKRKTRRLLDRCEQVFLGIPAGSVRRAVEQGTEKASEQQPYPEKASRYHCLHRGVRRNGQNRISGTDKQQGKDKGYPTPDEAAALNLFEAGIGFHGNLPAVIILV